MRMDSVLRNMVRDGILNVRYFFIPIFSPIAFVRFFNLNPLLIGRLRDLSFILTGFMIWVFWRKQSRKGLVHKRKQTEKSRPNKIFFKNFMETRWLTILNKIVFTINITNWLWIRYLYHVFTLYSLSIWESDLLDSHFDCSANRRQAACGNLNITIDFAGENIAKF